MKSSDAAVLTWLCNAAYETSYLPQHDQHELEPICDKHIADADDAVVISLFSIDNVHVGCR